MKTDSNAVNSLGTFLQFWSVSPLFFLILPRIQNPIMIIEPFIYNLVVPIAPLCGVFGFFWGFFFGFFVFFLC
jgi:hypothetical protein